EDTLRKPSVEMRVRDIDHPAVAQTPKEAQPVEGPVAADAGATRPGGLSTPSDTPIEGSLEEAALNAGQRFDLSPNKPASSVDAPGGDPLKPTHPDIYAAAKSGHPARAKSSVGANLKKFPIVPSKDEGKAAGSWKGITDEVRKKGEAAFNAAVG